VAVDALLLAVGMALLVAGGRFLVSGASQLAGTLGVSELTIGLTVVAFGTSAPELAVNTLAALQGSADIAFGNVVGSNIANIGLVIGVCAMLRPLLIDSAILRRELPMMLLATTAALILGLDRIRGESEAYDRADGVIFLLLFSIFLYYSIAEIVRGRRADPIAEAAAERAHRDRFWNAGKAALLAATGFLLLIGGAELAVAYASSLAEAAGVPRALIGLTVVALGTSLPELATSVVATWNGQTDLAVGNVVGSNIFNLLFILGATSVIRLVEVPVAAGGVDLAAMAAFSLALLLLARSKGSLISRGQGAALAAAYVCYMTWRVAG
jgi:cation:H+ antiporter